MVEYGMHYQATLDGLLDKIIELTARADLAEETLAYVESLLSECLDSKP